MSDYLAGLGIEIMEGFRPKTSIMSPTWWWLETSSAPSTTRPALLDSDIAYA